MEKTYISKDTANNNYILLIPVFYEHETRPAWRKGACGDLDTVKKALETAPESLKATAEENRLNCYYKRKEMIFLQERGRRKEAEAIRKQYQF